jgi:arabinose-5-phosphate isomerase
VIELVAGKRVILTGVGKSYDVARLGASLLMSVGCTATAVHATDMLHGGLNFLPKSDDDEEGVVIAFSHSGGTREVLGIVPHLVDRAMLIGVTSNVESSLADEADRVFIYHVDRDGSRHGTIPAYSLIEQVRWISNLACDLADRMTTEELAAGHPGGALGKAYTP